MCVCVLFVCPHLFYTCRVDDTDLTVRVVPRTHVLRLSRNSETSVSEFLENLEEMFPGD